MQKFICMPKSSQRQMICDSQQTKRSRPQYELRVRDWYRPPYRPPELAPQYLKATKSHRRWSRLKKSHRRWRRTPAHLSMCDVETFARITNMQDVAKGTTIRSCSHPQPKAPPLLAVRKSSGSAERRTQSFIVRRHEKEKKDTIKSKKLLKI